MTLPTLSKFNPTACLPCVHPPTPDRASPNAFAAGLERVGNTSRHSTVSKIRDAVAAFGRHVQQAFIRLVNPHKTHQGARTTARQDFHRYADVTANTGNAQSPVSVHITMASLRGLAWMQTIEAIDTLEFQLRQPRPISAAQVQGTFARLVRSLKLFTAPGIEGMGLCDEGRKTFATLLAAPVVYGLSASQLELLGDMPDLSRSRHPLMAFLEKAKGALVEHSASVATDAERGVSWTIPPRPAPRGAGLGTPI